MKNALYLLLFAGIIACQPEPLVVNDVPAADSKMVVSSIAAGDAEVSIFLTRSYSALEENLERNTDLIENYVISGAQAKITSEEGEVVLNELVPGVYGTDALNLISGRSYELEVYDPESNQTARAKTTMLEKMRFNQVSVDVEPSSIDTVVKVNYSFTDAPGESYYMINVQKVHFEQSEPEEIVANRVFTYLIDDQEIADGGELSGEFFAFFRWLSIRDTLIVNLSNISYEYYDYLERVNNGFLGPSLISEPYNYPTNIQNGYGFFNLYYRDNRLFIFGEEDPFNF